MASSDITALSSRTAIRSLSWWTCSRADAGMPISSLITSSGSRKEKSSTTSNRSASRSRSSRPAAVRRTNGSSAAIRRGVNSRPTILRCAVCSGGSLTIRNGASFSIPSMVHAVRAGEVVGVQMGRHHVVVPGQRPEAEPFVVIDRRLVAEPAVHRVGVVRGLPVEGVVLKPSVISLIGARLIGAQRGEGVHERRRGRRGRPDDQVLQADAGQRPHGAGHRQQRPGHVLRRHEPGRGQAPRGPVVHDPGEDLAVERVAEVGGEGVAHRDRGEPQPRVLEYATRRSAAPGPPCSSRTRQGRCAAAARCPTTAR